MKILADESVSARIIKSLRDRGLQVISIAETTNGISDKEVSLIAKDKGACLLTENKDFGTLVFAENFKKVSVVLLRYGKTEESKITENALSIFANDSFGKRVFITITADQIRVTEI